MFEGKDVEVRLIHTRTRDVMPLEWVISDGVVSATFYGKDQIDPGDYKLMLVENNGLPNMATIDECKAFTLVQCSCQEQRGEVRNSSLQLHKVQLASSFVLSGGGNISVEGYPNVDELEEVKELSGNENIIITDTEGNKKTTIGNLKEYVVKDISELPPFRIFETESDYNAVKDELGDCVVCLRDTGAMLYHVYNKTEEGGGEIEDKYIRFADPEVQRILVENFSADKVGMTSEDIAKVTDLGAAFKWNTTIHSFNEMSKFLNVKILNRSEFAGCSSLENVGLLNIEKIERTNGDGVFYKSGLKKAILPKAVSIGGWAFKESPNLESAFFGEGCTAIGSWTFKSCSSLKYSVVLNNTPPSLANNAYDGTHSDLKIYVPDASVEAYKTATNWSQYSSRIKGISELPIDNPTLYNEIKDYLN